MKFSIMTLFPEIIEQYCSLSIIGRARQNGYIDINAVQIRDFSNDKHRRVDDYPYGGGNGMVMTCQPIYDCHKSIVGNKKIHTIYMSPKGKTLTQKRALELSKFDEVVILCGHYEGIDERVLEEIVDEEISIGDYVLTGGELPAMVLIDCVSRMIDGVLANEDCYTFESHFNGVLEYPQYTRPEIWHDKKVPEVLLSGHHKNIESFKKEQSLLQTKLKRPDILK